MNITAHDEIWTQRTGSGRLSRVFSSLRQDWRLAGVVWTFCIATSLLLGFVLPFYWEVQIVVMPVTRSSSVNLGSALSGGLGGLAGGLGALLGRPASGEDEALAVLRSRELFNEYAQKNDLLAQLYADRWNAGFSANPTLRQAYKLFDTKIRDIDVDRRTGMVTMTITWKDREQAAQWARGLIDLTNQQLRESAIQDAQRNMDYLSGEMRRADGGITNNALKTALANSYDRELQNYMFAKGQPDFAFHVIDPPTIPDVREHIWPKRSLFAALGFILGGLLAVSLSLWRTRALDPR